MFKKNRIDISFWYLTSVIVMAILYFMFSRMNFEGMFTHYYNYYLVVLDRILPGQYNWGITILAVLLIWWVIIFIARDD